MQNQNDTKPIFQTGKATAIIDGQWGSTGKGKLAGYICREHQVEVAVCDFMPNAGHTFIDWNDKTHVFKQLPVAASDCFNDSILCLVGPHSCINLSILFEEMERENCANRVFIHPLAAIITDDDLKIEEEKAGHIAATCKGGHGANVRKMLRGKDAVLARDVRRLRPFIANTCDAVQSHLRISRRVLLESAQGFDLSLNHGTSYPHVTGRDCMLGRLCDNAGIPPRRLGTTIVSLRTFPIRVGDTEQGTSGPCYVDQQELTWEQIGRIAGAYVEPERTTVTKRVRRVFSWSDVQTRRMLDHLEPDYAFLNFANYLPKFEKGATGKIGQVAAIRDVLAANGCNLRWVGTGAGYSDLEVL